MNKTDQARFFADASDFHALVNRVDWAASPLGAPDTWPATLRANVGMMLDARIPMGIAWGPQRCLVYNEAYTSLLGEKHPSALGRPLAEVWAEIWPHIEPLVDSAYAGQARDLQDVGLEIRRNGGLEPGWFTIFCSPLRDDDGVVGGLSSTVIESTARMRAELEVRELNRTLDQRVAVRTAELERSETHLRSLFGQTAAGIAETDLDLRIVRANETLCRMLGRPAADLIGRSAADLIHPDDLETNRVAVAGMLASGRPVELENRYLRPDGSAVWVTKMVAPIVEPGDSAATSIMAVVVDVTGRREAETRWRESAERLQLAAEAANLGIWSWDAVHDRATWENERMYDIVGIERGGEPVNTERFLTEFTHPDDVAPYRQAMRASFDADQPFHVEGRFYHGPERELRWFEFTGRLHRDAGGRPWRMIGTAADITERKRVVEQLRDAKARLEATLNAGEIGTWMFDLRGYRIHADANMARLHGLSEAEAVDASPLVYVAAVHPDDLPAVRAGMDGARRAGTPYDCIYRARGRDGSERIIHARGQVEYEDGVPAWLPGVVIDITQQQATEERLRMREQRYRTLISSIDEGFAVVELVHDEAGKVVDHRFLETNAAYERHTGLVDVVGKTALEIAPDIEPRWHALYAQVAASGEPQRVVQHAEPLGRWFDIFIARLQGSEAGTLALVFRDVTAQKQADQALRQLADGLAQANRRQNEFLATLAHELRNPLAPIRTGLDLMRINPDNAAAGVKVRDMMERQVNHLIHLVNDLLDLARIQSGKIELKPRRVVLQDVVANAVEATVPLVQARHHRLDVRLPEQPIALDADPTRLVQVIGNLLTNAAKYTPEHGRIELLLWRDAGQAVIEVRDDGIGIPADAMPTLFEMFSQARHGSHYAQGGLGIGLSLVKSLVEQHGGSVSASSAGPHQGSAFTLRLPLDAQREAAAPIDQAPPGQARASARRRLCILIADDNLDAAELLAQSLKLDGHTVHTVHDGHAALAAIGTLHPDLALLDIGMPRMNGYQLAEAVRRDPALAGTVLAAVTGWGADADRERAWRAGFDHHLTKPVDLASIAALVAQVKPARRRAVDDAA